MATKGPDRTVTDEELLEAVQKSVENGNSPVTSTSKIASLTGISGTRVRELTRKVDEIESKKIGNNGPIVYWVED